MHLHLIWLPLCLACFHSVTSSTSIDEGIHKYDPCCSYPCQNNGICTETPSSIRGYVCDCVGTQFYGVHCETPTWWRWLKDKFALTPDQRYHLLYNYPTMWYLINNVGFLYKKALLYVYLTRGDQVITPHVYNQEHSYISLDVYYNRTYYARDLPPVPCNCPTPMGVAGPKELPSADELYERIFRRRKFKPDNRFGTNMIFTMYAQHFVHQFFKSSHDKGAGTTWGEEGMDASQVYGGDAATRWELRSKVNGKLKTRILDGEEYPPYLEDVPGVYMKYPTPGPTWDWKLNPFVSQKPVSPKWAMGHPTFSRSPDLFVIATIYIREHNRLCDILLNEHPDWDDERLYQTARLAILGEQMVITMAAYVKQLSQYLLNTSYRPEVVHGYALQYSNRIRHEFVYLYLWHQLYPEEYQIGNKTYNTTDLLYSNNAIIFEHGFDTVVEAFNSQVAGMITHRNHVSSSEKVTKHVINESRRLRLQSLNNYRRMIGFSPYTTFEEMTGERVIAQQLRELYKDVDAVEFHTGMMVERLVKTIVPMSMIGLGGPWAIKGIMANPLGSPAWWKPSTFGGDTVFNIVKESTLETLFCKNMKNKCKGFKIAFKVPDHIHEKLPKNRPRKKPCERKDL